MTKPQYRHVDSRIEQGFLLLTVCEPELHAGVAGDLLRELVAAVDAAGVLQVVLDCGKVTALTSAGIAALVAFRRHLRQRGGFLLLCQVDQGVADVLLAARPAGTGSSSKIPFGLAPDVAIAIAYLTGAGWGSYRLLPVEVGDEG